MDSGHIKAPFVYNFWRYQAPYHEVFACSEDMAHRVFSDSENGESFPSNGGSHCLPSYVDNKSQNAHELLEWAEKTVMEGKQ